MIFQKLKEETSVVHTRLEKNSLLKTLLQADIQLGQYQHILGLFWGFFAPLESLVLSFREIDLWLPDFAHRRKAEWIRLDLQNMGLEVNPNKMCNDLPRVRTLDQALGCLYVMEGSTLGGNIIARHIHKTLGIEKDTGLAFFSGYGEQTSAKWKSFQQALGNYWQHTGKSDDIIGAAKETFEKLDAWFTLQENEE
jgi:heme oxygenase (biliverdin-IX-beta and delta-forming)